MYAPAQKPLFGVLGVESEHNMSRPPGVSGQPPPAHRSLESAESAQLQLTEKSTHQRSPVKLDELHAPCAPQSASFKHGSQLLPLPTQLPKRCWQVGWFSAVSQMPHSAAFPQGHDGRFKSHSCVQILAPLSSLAHT